ncbi:hypothetical protein GGR51DRAFT_505229 [Nemania sp. FL0031]|nr:hypothetical protein GGR51DRAFT_505229 [Nemania sp. FL0031]
MKIPTISLWFCLLIIARKGCCVISIIPSSSARPVKQKRRRQLNSRYQDPRKRGPIMKYLLDLINQLIQKRMTGFTMLHDAMYQYYIQKSLWDPITGDIG